MPASRILKRTLGGLGGILMEKSAVKRKRLLEEAAKKEDVVKSIKELSRNIVLKNVPLDKLQKRKLVKHSKCIVKCSKIKGCCKHSSKLVSQSGGWLQIAIPIVAGLIADRFL